MAGAGGAESGRTGRRRTSGEVVIRVRGLKKSFGGRPVLAGVDLEVRRGETLVIMGGSGCGKSTLLRHLIGAMEPDEGTVEVLGKDLASLDEDAMNELRKRIGVLFQSGALFGSLSVGENVTLPLREHTDLDEEVIRIIIEDEARAGGAARLRGADARPDLGRHAEARGARPGDRPRPGSDLLRRAGRGARSGDGGRHRPA